MAAKDSLQSLKSFSCFQISILFLPRICWSPDNMDKFRWEGGLSQLRQRFLGNEVLCCHSVLPQLQTGKLENTSKSLYTPEANFLFHIRHLHQCSFLHFSRSVWPTSLTSLTLFQRKHLCVTVKKNRGVLNARTGFYFLHSS